MKGPSIAVMLGGHEPEEHDEGEPGYGESEESAKAGARALIQAVKAGDEGAVLRAFRSLSALCEGMDDLEESGESKDEGEKSDEE